MSQSGHPGFDDGGQDKLGFKWDRLLSMTVRKVGVVTRYVKSVAGSQGMRLR